MVSKFALLFAVLLLLGATPLDNAAFRHFADYLGWQYGDGAVRTLRVDATSQDFDRIEILQIGSQYRAILRNSQTGIERQHGLDDAGHWEGDENGFSTRSSEDVTTFDRTVMWVVSCAFMLDSSSPRESANPQVVIRRAQHPGLIASDLYFDRPSGALIGAVINPDGPVRHQLAVGRYADIGPNKLAIVRWSIDGLVQYSALTAIRVNAPITLKDLQPPVPTPRWSFGKPVVSPIKVASTGVMVKVNVNGQDGMFALDTGTTFITFAAPFARKVGVSPQSAAAVRVSGAVVPQGLALVKKISVGASSLQNVRVSIDSTTNLRGIDGLLGYGFLAGAIVSVDFDTNQIGIENPASESTLAPLPQQTVRLTPSLRDGVPSVDAQINGMRLNLELDTGRLIPSLIDRRFIVLGLKLRPQQEGCGMPDEMRLQEQVLMQPHVVCFGSRASAFGHDGVLGEDILGNYNWRIDYPNSRIDLIPRRG